MEVLAVIPARGGSKGIPRKNVCMLAGRPLISYSVEVAARAESVSRVVVSTDDAEIASVARAHGAEIVWRPAELSGDTASSESALLHALDCLERSDGYSPDLLVFMQCTSPLTLPEDVDGTVHTLLDSGADSAFAATPFHYFIWRVDSGAAVGVNHDKAVRLLRQEREPQYLETGAVYAMRAAAFRESRHRFCGRTALYVIPAERCLEIDEPEDLRRAELLMLQRERSERLNALPAEVSALVLDFDGVFTDNTVVVLEDGTEGVVCSRGDGLGLAQLAGAQLPVLVLSSERNPVVRARCEKLGLECIHGVSDKLPVLLEWLARVKADLASAVYVGNDVSDIPCMKAVGCGVAPADAYPEVRASARLVLTRAGGRGAIRELTDLIHMARRSKCGPHR